MLRGGKLFIIFLLAVCSFCSAYAVDLKDLPQIVKKVKDAVVLIETEKYSYAYSYPSLDELFEQFFNDDMFFNPKPRVYKQKIGTGSGFVIDKSGLVVTNAHVVEGADKIYATFDRFHRFEAEVVGLSKEYDIALLKLKNLGNFEPPVVELGDSDNVEVGQFVLVIGNPFGLERTVTFGVISAKGRRLNVQGNVMVDLFQTDAAINVGNSGGPVVDLDGKVIGIATAILAPAHGIGFLIPINVAKRFVEDFLNYGHARFAFLGVYTYPITARIAQKLGYPAEGGAVIADVVSGSPADEAGLREGDVIVKVDDADISSPADLRKVIRMYRPGDVVKIRYWREGRFYTANVKLGSEFGDEDNTPQSVGSKLPLHTLIDKIKKRFGVLGGSKPSNSGQVGSVVGTASYKFPGVVLKDVNSALSRIGLQVGDKIIAVNGKVPSTVNDVKKVVKNGKGKIIFERSGMLFELEFNISPGMFIYNMSTVDENYVRKILKRYTNYNKDLKVSVIPEKNGLKVVASDNDVFEIGDVIEKINGKKPTIDMWKNLKKPAKILLKKSDGVEINIELK